MLPFDIFPLHAEAIPRIVQGDYSSVRKRNFFVFSRYYVYTACLLAWEPKLKRVYSTPKLESTMVCADPKLRSAIAATNADVTRFFFSLFKESTICARPARLPPFTLVLDLMGCKH